MSAEGFRVLMEAITAQPVAVVPRCSDCGRPCPVLAVTDAGKFCGDCVDWKIGGRMKAARDEARRK